MIAAVADTHTAIWYLYNDVRLSARARTFIETAAKNGEQVALSSITLVELVYLIEKGRIPAISLTLVAQEFSRAESLFLEIPVDLKITRALAQVDVVQIPDMPDRIVAATGLLLGVPILSRDGKIRASTVTTIW